MINLTDAEIAERLRIAREFKHRTHGSEFVTEELFAEPKRKTFKRMNDDGTLPELSQNRYAIKGGIRRRNEIIRRTKESGGTFGVSIRGRITSNSRTMYQSFCGKPKHFPCAVEAAEARNEYLRKRYPGRDDVLMSIDAVRVKWGCECGQHGGMQNGEHSG